MKVVVCIKRVGVLGEDIEFTDDGRGVDPDYLDFELNEWDLYATEEAIRLRDAAGGGEVVVMTVGDDEAEEALVRCLAMGADRAIRIWRDDLDPAEPFTVAGALASAIRGQSPDLVLCGAQSADAAQGAIGVVLAALLDLPCVAVVTSIDVEDGGTAVVDRELEGGIKDVCEVELPAVMCIQTGINEPRYVTLRAVQQAEQSDIEVVRPESVPAPAYRVRRMVVPPRRRAEMIHGGPASIAARIAEIVREVAR
jgi:electron transfer flavoprotein beta subunit